MCLSVADEMNVFFRCWWNIVMSTLHSRSPPSKVGGMRGRAGAAPTRTSFHVSFSFRIKTFSALHWPRSLSLQDRGDLGLQLPKTGLSASGSSFLLWKGCCKSTSCLGGVQLQWFHCKASSGRNCSPLPLPKSSVKQILLSWPVVSNADHTKTARKASQESVSPSPQSCLTNYLDDVY